MAKKWMQNVHPQKGALRAKAKARGLVKGNNPLSNAALDTLAKSGGKTAKQVNLARIYKRANHG